MSYKCDMGTNSGLPTIVLFTMSGPNQPQPMLSPLTPEEHDVFNLIVNPSAFNIQSGQEQRFFRQPVSLFADHCR
jgi:hypothetical protein